MITGVFFALLAGMVILALVLPFLGKSRRDPIGAAELETYLSAQRDIDMRAKMGQVSVEDVKIFEAMAGRRLLSLKKQAFTYAPESKTRKQLAVMVIMLITSVASLGIYLLHGNPLLPAQPYAERMAKAPEAGDVAGLIERVEAHLIKNPNDLRGFELIAPIYLRMGRFDDAVRALSAIKRISGENPKILTDLAEAMTGQNQGIVPEEARDLFARAMSLSLASGAPSVKLRYYLGLIVDQDGQPQRALTLWQKLLTELPEGDQKELLKSEISRAEAKIAASKGSPQK